MQACKCWRCLQRTCVIMPCHRRRRVSGSARPMLQPTYAPAHTAAPRTAASSAADHSPCSSDACRRQCSKVLVALHAAVLAKRSLSCPEAGVQHPGWSVAICAALLPCRSAVTILGVETMAIATAPPRTTAPPVATPAGGSPVACDQASVPVRCLLMQSSCLSGTKEVQSRQQLTRRMEAPTMPKKTGFTAAAH